MHHDPRNECLQSRRSMHINAFMCFHKFASAWKGRDKEVGTIYECWKRYLLSGLILRMIKIGKLELSNITGIIHNTR